MRAPAAASPRQRHGGQRQGQVTVALAACPRGDGFKSPLGQSLVFAERHGRCAPGEVGPGSQGPGLRAPPAALTCRFRVQQQENGPNSSLQRDF